MSTRNLPPPKYTAEEQEQIIHYVIDLKSAFIREFLRLHEIPRSGSKAELRARIEEHLEDGRLSYIDLVELIDSVEPWGKQHVFLYDGPDIKLLPWKVHDQFFATLKKHRVSRYLNSHLPLILPEGLRLSSIEHSSQRIRITAVERRDSQMRDKSLDRKEKTKDGRDVELHAFVKYVSRGIIAFDWDLASNTAFLQVTELPSGTNYEEPVQRFRDLIGGWLSMDMFRAVNLSKSISHFHRSELSEHPETRSHGIDYATPARRRLVGRSASKKDPLLGEPVIDEALERVRTQGYGYSGNFYFIPIDESLSPIEKEVHVEILAEKGRVRFRTQNEEKIVRHVLQRVREGCR